MAKGDYLGEFEQLVMLALIRLGPNAYGMKIRQEIEKRADRKVSIGSVYATLDRLEEKGYVSSSDGEATSERGGRAKRYFQVTAPGEAVLSQSYARLRSMWRGVKLAGEGAV